MNEIISLGFKLLTALSIFTQAVFAQETATNEADTVRERVQEKVEEAKKVPRAYIGSVTDIVESTLQIKSGTGEILQAVTDKEKTTFVKINKTTKEVKFSDLAIGDFVIAMGYKNGNGVLDTTRVLITTPLVPTKRKAIYAQVLSTDSESLQVKTLKDKEELIITQDDDLRITTTSGGKLTNVRFSAVEEGDILIVVGAPDEKDPKTLVARRIHLVPPPSSPSPTPTP